MFINSNPNLMAQIVLINRKKPLLKSSCETNYCILITIYMGAYCRETISQSQATQDNHASLNTLVQSG